MLNDIIFILIMIFILQLMIVFIMGQICFGRILYRVRLRYVKPYLCRALLDFPVPRKYNKFIWWYWIYRYCYLRLQDNQRFDLYYARIAPDGLLIREHHLKYVIKPKFFIFVPWHALSEIGHFKRPWYLWWDINFCALNIKGSPITLLISNHVFEKIKSNL